MQHRQNLILEKFSNFSRKKKEIHIYIVKKDNEGKKVQCSTVHSTRSPFFSPSPSPSARITRTKFTVLRAVPYHPPRFTCIFIALHALRARACSLEEAEQRGSVRGGERKWSSCRVHGVVSIFAQAWTGLCAGRRRGEGALPV